MTDGKDKVKMPPEPHCYHPSPLHLDPSGLGYPPLQPGRWISLQQRDPELFPAPSPASGMTGTLPRAKDNSEGLRLGSVVFLSQNPILSHQFPVGEGSQ